MLQCEERKLRARHSLIDQLDLALDIAQLLLLVGLLQQNRASRIASKLTKKKSRSKRPTKTESKNNESNQESDPIRDHR